MNEIFIVDVNHVSVPAIVYLYCLKWSNFIWKQAHWSVNKSLTNIVGCASCIFIKLTDVYLNERIMRYSVESTAKRDDTSMLSHKGADISVYCKRTDLNVIYPKVRSNRHGIIIFKSSAIKSAYTTPTTPHQLGWTRTNQCCIVTKMLLAVSN